MKPVQEYQIYTQIQSYIKQYPTFTRYIEFKTPITQRVAGFESRTPEFSREKLHQAGGAEIEGSIKRTKTKISDILLSNEFNVFATFTFDPRFVDRSDPKACKVKMSNWLKRQREHYGKFNYIIIPEFHKDGKSLHFHALLGNYKGKLTEVPQKSGGRPTYNISSYKLGYSTAVKLDHNIEKVANYVKKYITKDMPQFAGKKRYWCSTDLIRPKTIPNPTLTKKQKDSLVQIYNKDNYTLYLLPDIIPLPTN